MPASAIGSPAVHLLPTNNVKEHLSERLGVFFGPSVGVSLRGVERVPKK